MEPEPNVGSILKAAHSTLFGSCCFFFLVFCCICDRAQQPINANNIAIIKQIIKQEQP